MENFIKISNFNIKNKVGIYVFNKNVIPPLKLYTGWPGLTAMPEDFPDEKNIGTLRNAFPDTEGSDLIRLEDHIRHNPVTLLCSCRREEAPAIQEKLMFADSGLEVKRAGIHRNHNSGLLPPLNGGQWQVCAECTSFSQTGSIGRCSKRWVCKWGASKPREWDVLHDPVCFHSQCLWIERQFRFEAAFLAWTKNFVDEVQKEKDPAAVFAEQKRLLHRDLAAAAEHGKLERVRKRCQELEMTFAEFAEKSGIVNSMLSFWKVNRKLIENVRFLHSEGIVLASQQLDELLRLSGEEEDLKELHAIIAQMTPKM